MKNGIRKSWSRCDWPTKNRAPETSRKLEMRVYTKTLEAVLRDPAKDASKYAL
jgi:hypothetical protein